MIQFNAVLWCAWRDIKSNKIIGRQIMTILSVIIFAFAVLVSPLRAEGLSHGIAMQGKPALPADYPHFPYANPNAPQGGRLTYGVYGTFDSLNPFIIKSIRTTARGMWDPVFGNLVFESLMRRSRDEPFTLYGLIAEKVEMPEKRDWIEFHLNPKARFSDGEKVEVKDLLFTFNLLQEKGRPPYSSRMKQVAKMEQTGEHSVKIHFNDKASRETPLLFGLMPILPEHATDVANFENSTLLPPIGSGPYVLGEIKPGERIVYQRNNTYWARDLPIGKGFYNFDEIRIDYFGNASAQFEAFKKGLFDIHPEGSPLKWNTAYNFDAVIEGRATKQAFEKRTPSGMLGFVFNTRREKFANANVRRALAMAFDFEWSNENLFYSAFKRTTSYWQNSSLSSLDHPASEKELSLLGDYASKIPADILDGSYRAPKTDGSGRDRKVLRKVLSLLRKQGFSLRNGKMLDAAGKPLAFELMIAGSAGVSGQDMERLALGYQATLAKLGIAMTTRFVDDSQFQARKGSFDYDMTIVRYSSSLSPGSEQIWRWGSRSRNAQGTFNFAGTAEPVLDRLIDAMLAARNRDDFEAAVRAFDRVLISGHYVVPLYHLGENRLAYWTRLGFAEYVPLYGPRFPTWWAKDGQ